MDFFTDQIGAKTVFCYETTNGNLICGSQLNYVTDLMKDNAIKRVGDKYGISCILTYGYMLDDHTCVENIKRIYPGDYLVWEKGKFTVKTYYALEPKKIEGKTEQEYI